ncbi:biopolymer transport protein exbB, partial [Yersinia pestis PY-10]
MALKNVLLSVWSA